MTYKQSSSYTVTIPKTITLGTNKQASYSVKVSGDIGTNQRVYVAPVDGITDTENIDFYMEDQTADSKKADVVATVAQNKTHWNSEDVSNAYEETNNSVSAPDLTAGTWEGIFRVEIRLETVEEQEHVHNYIDGKCECGAIDPNHTHNYEDGTCTICGKENDPYETAPASAYSNWNYTLDDENGMITLNYYKGSETDVIVYANYIVNGKTYKTQIASYGENGTTHGYYMFNASVANDPKKNIKSIKFSHEIDTSNVTNMRGMFYHCNSLIDLDISKFNTTNVTDMSQMFREVNSLVALDISSFDTSNVTDMSNMFQNCYNLTSLDLSNFDTSKVTLMGGMFNVCRSLTNLNISNFDTTNVTDMNRMFSSLYKIESLDLSNFDTSKVTNMSWMFYNMPLASLDLSSFDTSKVTDMSGMFHSASGLKTIYVTEGKWSTSKTTTDMFKSCGTSAVTYK